MYADLVPEDQLSMGKQNDWTRTQLLIALNLYDKVAFGKLPAGPKPEYLDHHRRQHGYGS